MLSHNGSNTNYELISNWMNLAINKLWGNYLVSVWMLLKWNELRVCVLICGSRALFMGSSITFFSKNNFKFGSHDTIHTFKNYFVTVFSVFNFQFLAIINSIQTDPIWRLFSFIKKKDKKATRFKTVQMHEMYIGIVKE